MLNSAYEETIRQIQKSPLLEAFEHKTVMITGATGLIGSALCFALLEWNHTHDGHIAVLAVARNRAKCEKLFADHFQYGLKIIEADITQFDAQDMGIHYIIHCANPTSSSDFVRKPVEVVKTAILGTANMLELARCNPIEGFVYLSSMEVYGTPHTDETITETHPSDLDALQVRNSYPESKRMCENLCADYASEYQVPAKIVRLTQTFGPGVTYQDGRIFAEFARCVIEQRDIILRTKGETKRCYLYTGDAVTAILSVLLKGENGQAYNAANEETYCSIYEMAQMVSEIADPPIHVRIQEEDIQKYGYAPVFRMNLSAEKLKKLGWQANTSLTDMYRNMIAAMREDLG